MVNGLIQEGNNLLRRVDIFKSMQGFNHDTVNHFLAEGQRPREVSSTTTTAVRGKIDKLLPKVLKFPGSPRNLPPPQMQKQICIGSLILQEQAMNFRDLDTVYCSSCIP